MDPYFCTVRISMLKVVEKESELHWQIISGEHCIFPHTSTEIGNLITHTL